jgi:hypothetical protein
MTVWELMKELADTGATVKADGGEVAVIFPEEHRRHIEELGPEIRRLKPQLLRELSRSRDFFNRADRSGTTGEIELALKVGRYLNTFPGHRSVTASEIADTLFGKECGLDRVLEVYRICEELREARIVIKGRDGYGYQSVCWGRKI